MANAWGHKRSFEDGESAWYAGGEAFHSDNRARRVTVISLCGVYYKIEDEAGHHGWAKPAELSHSVPAATVNLSPRYESNLALEGVK